MSNLAITILQSVSDNITSSDSPERFIESLDEMFASFINDDSGSANEAQVRREVFSHYLALKSFLTSLSPSAGN